MSMSLAFIIAFFAIMIFINVKNMKVADYEDYATSRGSFGKWAVACAVFASWYSGSIFNAWADFSVGFGFIGIYVMIYSSIMLVFYFFVAERVYLWGKKYRLSTLGEFLGLRYRSKTLRLLVGLVGLVFPLGFLLLEWVALGVVFHYATGLSSFTGMVIGVVVMIIYVVTGGMRSVVKANMLQGSYMFFIGVGVMFYLIYSNFGSFSGAMTVLNEKFPDLLTYPGPGWDPPSTYWTSIILLSALASPMLPHVFNKLLAADSVKSIKQGSLIAPIMSIIFWAAFTFLGMVLHTFDYAKNNPYEAYIWIAQQAGPLPMALMSVLIVAAGISSAAGMIQAISSVVTTDIVSVINRKITDKQSVLIARVTVVVFSIITLYVASLGLQKLIFMAFYTYQGLVILFPITALGLYWKRANKVGAIVSLVVGITISMYISLAQPAFLADLGWQGGIYGVLVAFAIMIIDGFLHPVDSHVGKLWKDIEGAKNRSSIKGDRTIGSQNNQKRMEA
ncbi:sodium:solute symporter [Ammoniphilus sp. 3BR4]|uniref:sodium:solute symporter family protein n=1 Tax=Ammoniphilus sp. 3BR4 TaxID=3158265 RepID=UPI0034670FA7